MQLFETERLLVRRFTSADEEAFYRINSNPLVMQYIRPVKDREACAAFLQENLHLYQDGSLVGRFAVVEKAGGRLTGTFSCLYLTAEASFHLGYAFLPEAWNKGLATELLISGAACFFEQNERKEIFAITEAANHASRRVLLKAGFFPKGQVIEGDKLLELYVCTRD